MASLLGGGKFNGVFTLAVQGISKAVGFLTKAVITLVDEVVETVSTLTAPLTDALTQLPVVGDTLKTVLDTSTGLLADVSQGVHAVSDQLLQGDLSGGIDTLLNGTTDLVGQTLDGVSDILDSVLDTTAPLLSLPVIGDVVASVGQTTSNLSGLISETGNYVAGIQPLDLVNDVLSNPVASVGGVLQDVSGTIDALLDDLAPITDTAADLPVIGSIVTTVGATAGAVNDSLYDLGTQLGKVGPLDLELQLAYV
ncbi:hypothetical protein Asch01_02670 [Acinetobacter schindleri]|uniref:hypothetical protein n=1 Tax=Acinetobacter schindleri TaxID=108981 RepID=UPI0030A58CE4